MHNIVHFSLQQIRVSYLDNPYWRGQFAPDEGKAPKTEYYA
jgi:hypothetical protein